MATVSKTPIQTIVFFDLEATSLRKPRITELCLLSVQREEFLTPEGLPRVVNKLTLCINPQKAISPIASNMTGLYNDSLESQTPFDNKVVDIMAHFLSRLPQPVCLVAHYGNGFDYPLLNAELKRAKCEFPLDVVCVDSLDAIRAIDMQTLYEEERLRIDIQNQNNSTPTRQGIQSNQGVPPNNSTIPGLHNQPAYTATVKQDTVLEKRKADAESIEHVRKRLFTDADKQSRGENSGIKTEVEVAISSCKENQTVEATRQPETAIIPTTSHNTPQQSKAQKEEQHVGQSIAASLLLDSQQSVTDDMLMEALDHVEANENSVKAGTSMTRNLSSVGNLALQSTTQRTSPPLTSIVCSNDDSKNGAGNDKAGLPDTSRKSGGCCTGNITPVSTGVNNNVTPVSTGVNNNITPVSTGVNNNVTPVSTGVNNNVTPISTGVNNNITPVSTGVNNNVTPVSTGVNNNVTPVSTGVNNNVTPVSTGVNNNITPVSTGDNNNITPVSTGVNNNVTPVSTGVNNNGAPVSTGVNNNITPVCTGVNNNVTPVSTGVNNNVTPVSTGDNNNGAPVSTGVNNNVTPVSTGVNNTPVSTGVNNNSVVNQDQVTPIVLPKVSYKLEEIYYRTFGEKPPLSHNAEDDCITLMKVCKKRCPQFLEWINKYQVLLSTLPPMY